GDAVDEDGPEATSVIDSKAVKDRAVESSKRLGEELKSDNSKKQKLDDNVQAKVADDDTANHKRCI
nr:hypothetical protein [Tanacetum cinerariifolium]